MPGSPGLRCQLGTNPFYRFLGQKGRIGVPGWALSVCGGGVGEAVGTFPNLESLWGEIREHF